MEDLAHSWTRLSLSEREGPGCCLMPEESVKTFSIAASFLTKRALNANAIARTFTPLWRAMRGFKIQHIGDHKILFSFEDKEDVDRIMGSKPRSFDKHLVVLQRYDNDRPLEDIKHDRTTFWVQVHRLPLRCMTIEAAEKVCGVVGEVIKQSDSKFYDGGNFIRVKVSVDITMPLCRGRNITLKDDKQVSFKYKRLPNICYWCGRLMHDDRDCEIWIESEGTLKNDQKEFGPSLRSPPFVVSKKNTIVVPGYYSMRKTTMKGRQTSQPMNEEQPDQQNQSGGGTNTKGDPNGSDRYMQGSVTHSMCNSQIGINPCDHACPVSSQPLMSNLNGMSSCPNGNESVFKEMNEVPQKSKRSEMSPDTFGIPK
ncbi:hypothetical protein SO802_031981 [Lithocarpus litseifolius]|uniref:CCHC-type domain-containing protein n=1 Tax=Lithocarpus litseifolius TaxID=425828 RepID=A0AAW2BSK6_9ROSI